MTYSAEDVVPLGLQEHPSRQDISVLLATLGLSSIGWMSRSLRVLLRSPGGLQLAVRGVQGQRAQGGLDTGKGPCWKSLQQFTHDNDMLASFEFLHMTPESHIPLLGSMI